MTLRSSRSDHAARIENFDLPVARQERSLAMNRSPYPNRSAIVTWPSKNIRHTIFSTNTRFGCGAFPRRTLLSPLKYMEKTTATRSSTKYLLNFTLKML